MVNPVITIALQVEVDRNVCRCLLAIINDNLSQALCDKCEELIKAVDSKH